MEKMPIESNEDELNPEALGFQFRTMDFGDFILYLRKQLKKNPSARFLIITEWKDVDKARSAKALLDGYGSRFNIDSITIRATCEQHDEDVNVFESGVKWEES